MISLDIVRVILLLLRKPTRCAIFVHHQTVLLHKMADLLVHGVNDNHAISNDILFELVFYFKTSVRPLAYLFNTLVQRTIQEDVFLRCYNAWGRNYHSAMSGEPWYYTQLKRLLRFKA